MSGVIAQAKANATSIMNLIESNLPGADLRFGVVDFRDYADGGAWPYIYRQPLTGNKNDVQTAVNAISHGGGGDLPEAYSRVMYESYNSMGYRNNAVRILVMMGDNQPHDTAGVAGDAAYNPAPYYDPIAGISTNAIAGNMAANRIILMNLHSGGHNATWTGIANITGGSNMAIAADPANITDVIVIAVIRAIYDSDGDSFMRRTCPCDPANLPPGITGCFDCDDDPVTGPGIVHECLYGGLVPCGRLVDDPNTPGIDETAACTLCHFFVLAKRTVDEFLIPYIIFPVGVLIVLIGGIIWLTASGDPGRISQGKKILFGAIIGIVIVLAAWLIVDLIITFITPAASPFQSWGTINCPVP
jgi:hypothetical protein